MIYYLLSHTLTSFKEKSSFTVYLPGELPEIYHRGTRKKRTLGDCAHLHDVGGVQYKCQRVNLFLLRDSRFTGK